MHVQHMSVSSLMPDYHLVQYHLVQSLRNTNLPLSRCRHNHISDKFARAQDAAFMPTPCQLKDNEQCLVWHCQRHRDMTISDRAENPLVQG